MWLNDVEKAICAIREHKPDVEWGTCFKSIEPAYDGIVFTTTYHTYVKWFSATGQVIERRKDDWLK